MRSLIGCLAAATLALVPAAAAAQRKPPSIIRDAEIENTIRAYSAPIFNVAGFDASSILVRLVNDKSLNAFVAGGQRMFIHTGLLLQAEYPGQVIGVIAHETGHIAGGHLARNQDALRNATAEAAIAAVLGIGAAVLTGNAGAAAAGASLGGTVAQRGYLSYRREQEQAADQAALTYLDTTGQSARGMLEFFELLEGQELLAVGRQDPYVRSHPIAGDRVEFVREHVANSQYSDIPDSPEMMEMHERMRAKLVGFLFDRRRALKLYPETDNSIAGRYARAIAHSRKADMKTAMPIIDSLVAERPDDPYFHELKGELLFDNGRVEEALPPYVEAVRLLPNAPLMRVALAQVQVALNRPDLDQQAVTNLDVALQQDRRMSLAWHLMATAVGRQGDIGMAALALAEEAMLRGDRRRAREQSQRAQKLLSENSGGWLRAADIMQATEPRE